MSPKSDNASDAATATGGATSAATPTPPATAVTPASTGAEEMDPILERERRARLRARLSRKFYGSPAPTARDWTRP